MQPLAAFVIAEHIRDIHREADAARRAGLVAAPERGRAAWRRRTGAAARWLASALENVAVRLDPAVRRPSYGRE